MIGALMGRTRLASRRRFGLSFGCFNPWFDVWRRTCLRACI
ncbi:MAG: hypothetical protein OXH50_02245 [Gemmatimonadetes bacterium]|nr:hypothetical protein [Gemmatimonadota bacterium]